MQPNEVKAALEELDVLGLDHEQALNVIREVKRRTNGNGPYEYVSQFGKRHGIQGEEVFRVWNDDDDGPDVLDELRARAAKVRDLDATDESISKTTVIHDFVTSELVRSHLEASDALELEPMPLDIMVSASIPKPPELIAGIMREGEAFAVVGPNKSLKSQTTLELALYIASGSTWHGHKCEQQGVLYIDAENGLESTSERISKLLDGLSFDVHSIGNRFHLYSIAGMTIGGEAATFDTIGGLVARAKSSCDFDVLVLDPFYMLEDGDENDNAMMREWARKLANIKREFDLSLIVTHHTAKDGGSGGPLERARGGGAFGGWFHGGMGIRHLAPKPEQVMELEHAGIVSPETACYQVDFECRHFQPRPFNAINVNWRLVPDYGGILDGAPVANSRQANSAAATRTRHATGRNKKHEATAAAVEACEAAGELADRRTVWKDYLETACRTLGVDYPTYPTFRDKWTDKPAVGRKAQTGFRPDPKSGELVDTTGA